MIYQRLKELEDNGTPVNVGLIATGTFGAQIVAQTCQMVGIRIAAIAELDPEKAKTAYERGGIAREHIADADGSGDIDRAIADGHPAVTRDSAALIESDVHVIVEATGNVEVAARHARDAIANQKHVVMVTVEGDVVYGNQLKKLADEAGVLYSAAHGDEPSIAFQLWDWARALGFRVIAAGKGTRFITSFRKANPDDVPRLYGFTGVDYNAQMFGSFLDGTKHAIEMCALSNMTGLVPDVRGMHFPAIDLREMPDKLCHKDKGGILESEGVVEAVSAAHEDDTPVERNLRGGLYAVVDGPVPALVEWMKSYGEITGMITGEKSDYAMIYRPQHFVGLEMPLTIAHMVLDGVVTGTPIGQFSEVVCAAKKSMKAGETLDGEGGYCVYGLLEKAAIAKEENLLPVGLSQGAELVRDVAEDEMINYDDVELPESVALELRRAQDA